MTLQPRDYQLQCLEKIKKGNTIISMPTGGGKTLVAVLALDHFLAKRGKAIFAVPTRVLVEQQAKYCREKCQHRRLVVELSGGEMDSWGKDRWRQCVCENEILVGTPEVFRKALVENGYITPLDFSIIIFDEYDKTTMAETEASNLRVELSALMAKLGVENEEQAKNADVVIQTPEAEVKKVHRLRAESDKYGSSYNMMEDYEISGSSSISALKRESPNRPEKSKDPNRVTRSMSMQTNSSVASS